MTEDDPVSKDPGNDGSPQSGTDGDPSVSNDRGDPEDNDTPEGWTQKSNPEEPSVGTDPDGESIEKTDRADRPSAVDGTVDTSRAETDQGHGDVERSADRTQLQTGSQSINDRVRWKWGLRIAFLAGIMGVIVGAVSVFGLHWGPLPGVGAFILFAVGGIEYVFLLYRSWQYEIRADALYLERGVFTHVKTVVPFVRVQHIDTSRDPVDRAIGLSSLVVFTAGSRGADVTIPGLPPGEAEDLQSRLKVLAKESTGDDAV